ncbi:MAG: HEAT repeat domain-containing protein [bacterium]
MYFIINKLLEKSNRIFLPLLRTLCFMAVFAAACGHSDYDRAEVLYKHSRNGKPPAPQEYSEPISQAIQLLESFLARNHDEPRGTLLLWRCYLRAGNPRAQAMHESILRNAESMRQVLPDEIEKEDDPYMRERMVRLLGEIATVEEVKALTGILADDPHPLVQQAVAQILARLRDDRAIKPLLAKARAGDVVTRAAACRALAAFPQPPVSTTLLSMVVDSTEAADVRESAAFSLAEIATLQSNVRRELLPKLEIILTRPLAPFATQLLAALILAILGDDSGYQTAFAHVSSNDVFLRGLAVTTLGHIGSAQTVHLIAAAVGDDNPKLRQQAAEALGNIGDMRGLPSLYRAMDDPVEPVRLAAQKAIDKIRRDTSSK